jgi:hypothetical protein
MDIYFSSAPAGAGKTHFIVENAINLANNGHKVLILQPTKELIHAAVKNELKGRERKRTPHHSVFTGDEHPGRVVGALMEYFGEPADCGEIVFTTHQAFFLTPFLANKGDWSVMIDEAPEVVRHQHHSLPLARDFLIDRVELDPGSAYSPLQSIEDEKTRRFARNREGDDIVELLRYTFQLLSNENWMNYVNTREFEALRSGEEGRFNLHSILDHRSLMGSSLSSWLEQILSRA